MYLVSYVSSIYLFILDLALEIGIAGCILEQCATRTLHDLPKRSHNTCSNETTVLPLKNQMSSDTIMPMSILFSTQTHKDFITKLCKLIVHYHYFFHLSQKPVLIYPCTRDLLIANLLHTAVKQL